jgi:MoxR-like ATPase
MMKKKAKTQYNLHTVLPKVRAITKYLNSQIVDRSSEIQSLMLTLVADTSCLFIGPRGTSKTDLIRKFADLTGLSLFDTLISQSTKPDQIFGPIDVPALANGVSRYKIDGHAPTAKIVFFDEVFKASGVVLNPLLWFLNEKIFRNGDEGIIKCPLQAVFAASNEIPSDQDMAPIYDRFVIRHHVDYLATSKDVHKMFDIIMSRATLDVPVPEQLGTGAIDWLRREVRKVEIPYEVREKLVLVRSQIKQSIGLQISDRRLGVSLRILQAVALLKGRMKVKPIDIQMLSHVFWDETSQIKKVNAIIGHHSDAVSADLQALVESAQSIYDAAIKSGNLQEGITKIGTMLESTKKHTSAATKKIHNQLDGIFNDLTNLVNLRNTMTVFRVTDQVTWWKLADESANLWSSQQIRGLGFKWRRRGGYWWQPSKSEQRFKKKAAEDLKTTVTFKDLY